MMRHNLIVNMSLRYIYTSCGVSLDAAKYQYDHRQNRKEVVKLKVKKAHSDCWNNQNALNYRTCYSPHIFKNTIARSFTKSNLILYVSQHVAGERSVYYDAY